MAEPWPVHTLVFDLDDTLYPERDYVLSGFAAVGSWLEREHAITGFTPKATELFGAGRRGHIFDEALLALGAAVPVTRLLDVYRQHEPELRLDSAAMAILEWARPLFRLGVVTDGYLDVQRGKAEALGLRRWTDHIVFSDQWGREAWKPSRRPFEEMMRQLPGTPAGFVYIGDNPRKDFIAPRALGWHSVRLRRPGGEYAGYEPGKEEMAEREVTSLAELRRLVVAG
jgi:putative hydrolase of the HAD superfamily